MTQSNIENFQILSLDGGGIKGVYIAAMLAAIEKDHNTKIVDHFDLIAGTSTGGIIAIGLGLGFSPAEILKMYIDNGSEIFKDNWFASIKHYFTKKHDRLKLEDIIKDFYKEKKFGESSKRLIIPSFSLTNNDIYLFRTPHAAHLIRDWKLEAYKVALSTSAAPTYFSTYLIDSNRLVDGGVWANNPVMVAITEAVSFLDIPLNKIKAVSFGTTDEVKMRHDKLDHGGKFAWASSAPDLIMTGQSIGATKQAENFLGTNNFLRINSAVSEGEFSLDKIKGVDELVGKAFHDSRKHSIKIRDFLNHSASPYTPLYK